MKSTTGRPTHTRVGSVCAASSMLLAVSLAGCTGATQPMPSTTTTTTTTAASSAAPTPTSSVPGRTTEWPGPLRSESSAPAGAATLWADAADADLAEVDIRQVRLRDVNGNGRLDWVLKLAGSSPTSTTLASQDRVVEYGIVIDTDGDLDADCELGINNDAPDPSGFRVWLKNTNTGVTDEQIGGPYGGLFVSYIRVSAA